MAVSTHLYLNTHFQYLMNSYYDYSYVFLTFKVQHFLRSYKRTVWLFINGAMRASKSDTKNYFSKNKNHPCFSCNGENLALRYWSLKTYVIYSNRERMIVIWLLWNTIWIKIFIFWSLETDEHIWFWQENENTNTFAITFIWFLYNVIWVSRLQLHISTKLLSPHLVGN